VALRRGRQGVRAGRVRRRVGHQEPARLKDAKVEGLATNGGFDNTVGGRTRWQDMDFGPFFSSTITPPLNKANVTHKAVSIRLGKDKKHFVTFDTELLRMSAAWEGSSSRSSPAARGWGTTRRWAGSRSSRPAWGRGGLWATRGADAWADPAAGQARPLPAPAGGTRACTPVAHLSRFVPVNECRVTDGFESPHPDGAAISPMGRRGSPRLPDGHRAVRSSGRHRFGRGHLATLRKGESLTAAECVRTRQASLAAIGSRDRADVPPQTKGVDYCVLMLPAAETRPA
jgi:hypothetical protein